MPARSSVNVNNEFRISNLTTSHFLGARERSWMRHGATSPQTSSLSPYAARPNVNAAALRRPAPSLQQDAQTTDHQEHSAQGNRNSPPEETAVPVLSQGTVEANTGSEVTGQNTDTLNHTASEQEIVDLTRTSQQGTADNDVQHQSPVLQTITGHAVDVQHDTPQRSSVPPQSFTSSNSTPSATSPDVASEKDLQTSLNGRRSLSATTSPVSVTHPPSQLLTPVASPEQALQNLHRKRILDPTQTTDHAFQPANTRVRSESTRQAPLSSHIPYQPNVLYPTQYVRQGVLPPNQLHPNSLRRQASLSRNTLQQPSTSAQPSAATGNQTPHRQAPSHALTATQSKGLSYLAVLKTMTQDLRERVQFTRTANTLRLPWLHSACECGDLAFLLLNQILCATFLDTMNFMRLLEFNKTHLAGMATLEMLFGANKELPRDLTEFFAGWPNSLYSLKSSPELTNWIALISHSLIFFGTHWNSFRQLCIQRGIPPCAREIAGIFQCGFSLVLSRAVFSSLSRQVTISVSQQHARLANIDAFQVATFDLFVKDQEDYCSSLGSLSLPPLEKFKASFDASYLRLYQKYFQHPHPSQTQTPGSDDSAQIPRMINTNNIAGPHNGQLTFVPGNMQFQASHSGNIVHAPVYNAPMIRGVQVSPNSVAPTASNFQQQSHRQTVPSTTEDLPPNRGCFQDIPPNVLQNGMRTASSGPKSRPTLRSVNWTVTNPRITFTGPQSSPPVSNQVNGGPIQQVVVQDQVVAAPTSRQGSTYRSVPGQTSTSRHVEIPFLPARLNQNPLLANPVHQQEAIHQAHLQEPVTLLSKNLPSTTTRIYQFMDKLVLSRMFRADDSFFTASFEIHNDVASRIARRLPTDQDVLCPSARVIDNKSVIFHLRCAQVAATMEVIAPEIWAALTTYWPEHILIAVNDHHLEFRRKRNYNRDLPVDITDYVRQGINKIVVSFHANDNDLGKSFAIGCETITFCDPSLATQMPEKLSSDESLKRIVQAMQVTASDDDDEMQIVTDSLIISVTDPFSSSLYVTPVRGKTCLHRECFSLETFLQSRTSDNRDALTSVSQWLCPHCKRDARPCSLVVDGFLQEVCLNLVITGDTEARAIELKPDGSWKVRKEEDTEDRTTARRDALAKPVSKPEAPALERPSSMVRQVSSTAQPAVVETIDLAGDD